MYVYSRLLIASMQTNFQLINLAESRLLQNRPQASSVHETKETRKTERVEEVVWQAAHELWSVWNHS